MAFGSLTAQQRAMVLLELRGGQAYAAQMGKAAASTGALRKETNATGLAMQSAGRRTWLMNQATYTFRRYAFFATLAATSAAAGLIKLGAGYLSARQQAAAALSPILGVGQGMERQLDALFQISKYSPFVLKDLTTAFRVMYGPLSTLGISAKTVENTIQAITDALSFAGKTTPAALNRVSTALQHMAFQGRLTGQGVTQLARDGLPIWNVLNKEFGVTQDQLHQITKLGIPAGRVLTALTHYIETTAPYAGAAQRISMQTFTGLLAVARDSISQIMGNLISGGFGGGQSILYKLAAPGGPLDRLSALSKHGLNATIMGLSQMLTGSGLAGRGLLTFTQLLHNLWRVFTTEVIPAFAIATSSLVVFWPIIFLVNGVLATLARHTTLVKIALIPLASVFIITHTAAIGLWGITKLLNIAMFGEALLVKSLWKQMILLTTMEGRKVLMDKLAFIWTLRNVEALKMWAFNQKVVYGTQILQGPVRAGMAKYIRMMFFVNSSILTATASTREFTIALLSNPFTWIAVAVGILAAALYLVIFRMDLVKKKLSDIQKWIEKYSFIWRLIQWSQGGSFTGSTQGGFSKSVPQHTSGLFPGVNTWLEKHVPGYQWQEQFSMFGAKKGITKSNSPEPGSLASIMTTGQGNQQPMTVQVVVDRKVIAEANARALSDAQARK